MSLADNTFKRNIFTLTSTCPQCGSTLQVKTSHQNKCFIGCAQYPFCRYTVHYSQALQDLGEQLTVVSELAKALAERAVRLERLVQILLHCSEEHLAHVRKQIREEEERLLDG